jgi:hypothetical protein
MRMEKTFSAWMSKKMMRLERKMLKMIAFAEKYCTLKMAWRSGNAFEGESGVVMVSVAAGVVGSCFCCCHLPVIQ